MATVLKLHACIYEPIVCIDGDFLCVQESGVGKSSIVLRFVSDSFKSALESTIGWVTITDFV